jgi:hypothetical protein
MQKIIAVLIITYTLGSFFTTIGDLAAIKDVQVATVQPSSGNGR